MASPSPQLRPVLQGLGGEAASLHTHGTLPDEVRELRYTLQILVCYDYCVCCVLSLAEYADVYGRLPEYRVWGFLVDLVKVSSIGVFFPLMWDTNHHGQGGF